MKKFKFGAIGLCLLTLVSCSTAAGNGALIGTGAGAGLGLLAGRLIGGNNATSKLVGAGVGAAVGATVGTLIGKHMDKVKAQAKAAAANAAVETVQIDGLDAIRVTFDNGILFSQGKATLQSGAQSELAKFADVLKTNSDCNVAVLGFASSEGSDATNLSLSKNRANAVVTYLKGQGVNGGQITKNDGYGEAAEYLVMNSDGTENKEASRRVEVYMFASPAMIEAAKNGTLK